MAAFLVRHAKAGDRTKWHGDDRKRPLTKSGWEQAEVLSKRLRKEEITRVASSPAVRCVQTVEMLAEDLGLKVDKIPELAEGSTPEECLKLIRKHADDGIVISTHGDVMLGVLYEAVRPVPEDVPVAKGCCWVFEVKKGEIRVLEYIKPAD